MKVYVYIVLGWFIFSACSGPSVPKEVLDKCNKQQVECNQQAHKSSCGDDCVKKMLTDPHWSDKSFEEGLKKCTADYQKCLKS